jgi:hypothetical protein
VLEHCCGWRNGLVSGLKAAHLLVEPSKEAMNARLRAPPRRGKVATQSKIASMATETIPLGLLWMRIPAIQQQETLRRLTQMLAQRLAARESTREEHPGRREASDE